MPEPLNRRMKLIRWFAEEYPEAIERFIKLMLEQYVLCKADPSAVLQVQIKDIMRHIYGYDSSTPCIRCSLPFRLFLMIP
jgi:hypothetical protein